MLLLMSEFLKRAAVWVVSGTKPTDVSFAVPPFFSKNKKTFLLPLLVL